MQLLAEEHHWASTYRDQIPAGFFQGKLLPFPPRGGQAPEWPLGAVFQYLFQSRPLATVGIFAWGISGTFTGMWCPLRNPLNSSQPFKTPAAILSLSYVSWCNKACPLPEAKPITGLADHACLLALINRFKQALFRSEPWNIPWVPLTMLAPLHRLEEQKWMKHWQQTDKLPAYRGRVSVSSPPVVLQSRPFFWNLFLGCAPWFLLVVWIAYTGQKST